LEIERGFEPECEGCINVDAPLEISVAGFFQRTHPRRWWSKTGAGWPENHRGHGRRLRAPSQPASYSAPDL